MKEQIAVGREPRKAMLTVTVFTDGTAEAGHGQVDWFTPLGYSLQVRTPYGGLIQLESDGWPTCPRPQRPVEMMRRPGNMGGQVPLESSDVN